MNYPNLTYTTVVVIDCRASEFVRSRGTSDARAIIIIIMIIIIIIIIAIIIIMIAQARGLRLSSGRRDELIDIDIIMYMHSLLFILCIYMYMS